MTSTPYQPDDDVVPQNHRFPTLDDFNRGHPFAYHGIPSLGQQVKQFARLSVRPDVLQCLAVLLEDAWNRFSETPFDLDRIIVRMGASQRALAREWPRVPTVSPEVCRQAAADAHSVGWRSHAQGIAAGRAYMRDSSRDRELQTDPIVRPLREGRTSSVLLLDADQESPLIVLNVARDLDCAAADLTLMAEGLQFAREHLPSSAAGVVSRGSAGVMIFGDRVQVPVLAVEYVPDMDEVHAVPRSDDATGSDLVLVCSFRSNDLSAMQFEGRRLTARKSDLLWGCIVRNLTGGARFDWDKGLVCHCKVEINDGDVVAREGPAGISIKFIATSGGVHTMPIGHWPYAMAMMSTARDDGQEGSIFWGQPELALQAIAEGLAVGGHPGRLIDLAHAALRMSPSDLKNIGTIETAAPAHFSATVERARAWLHAVGTPK